MLYTGQHIQQTQDVRQHQLPVDHQHVDEIRTVGDLLRDAGYYTAYKGKWHLTKEFETVNKLGYADTRSSPRRWRRTASPTTSASATSSRTRCGGYLHDGVTAAMGANWLRGKGRDARGGGQAVVPRREPGEPARRDVLRHRRPGTRFSRSAASPMSRATRSIRCMRSNGNSSSRRATASRSTRPGRPAGASRLLRSHDALVGEIPNEEPRWRRRHNYYLNCLRDVDRNIAAVLAELDARGSRTARSSS